MLLISTFSFSHNVFYSIKDMTTLFPNQFLICRLQILSKLGKSKFCLEAYSKTESVNLFVDDPEKQQNGVVYAFYHPHRKDQRRPLKVQLLKQIKTRTLHAGFNPFSDNKK